MDLSNETCKNKMKSMKISFGEKPQICEKEEELVKSEAGLEILAEF